MNLGNAATVTFQALSSPRDALIQANEDYGFLSRKLQARAMVLHQPWYLFLLPRPLRDRLLARRLEAALIKLWETSPHLLEDAGYVLSRGAADLPDHLVVAPDRVIDHIAARAPEEIAHAEAVFPPKMSAGPRHGA